MWCHLGQPVDIRRAGIYKSRRVVGDRWIVGQGELWKSGVSPVLPGSGETQPASGLLKGQKTCLSRAGVCGLWYKVTPEMTSCSLGILIWVKGVGWTTSSLRFFFWLWLSVVSVHPTARNGDNENFTPLFSPKPVEIIRIC